MKSVSVQGSRTEERSRRHVEATDSFPVAASSEQRRTLIPYNESKACLVVNNSINVQLISAGGGSMLCHHSVTFSGKELLVRGVGGERRSLAEIHAAWITAV